MVGGRRGCCSSAASSARPGPLQTSILASVAADALRPVAVEHTDTSGAQIMTPAVSRRAASAICGPPRRPRRAAPSSSTAHPSTCRATCRQCRRAGPAPTPCCSRSTAGSGSSDPPSPAAARTSRSPHGSPSTGPATAPSATTSRPGSAPCPCPAPARPVARRDTGRLRRPQLPVDRRGFGRRCATQDRPGAAHPLRPRPDLTPDGRGLRGRGTTAPDCSPYAATTWPPARRPCSPRAAGSSRPVARRRPPRLPRHDRQPRRPRPAAGTEQTSPRRWAAADCPADPAGRPTAGTWRCATAAASTSGSARATT